MNTTIRTLIATGALLVTGAAALATGAPHAHATTGAASASADMCRATAAAGAPNLVSADDVAATSLSAPTTVSVLANDRASAPTQLNASSLRFYGYASPAGARKALKVLSLAGQGTFVINPTGTITFTATAGFVGTTSRVCYKVSDTAGHSTAAYLTVHVQDWNTSNAVRPILHRGH